jgi:hypothetical protein
MNHWHKTLKNLLRYFENGLFEFNENILHKIEIDWFISLIYDVFEFRSWAVASRYVCLFYTYASTTYYRDICTFLR